MGDWDFVLISLLFVDDEHKCRRKKIHSRYRKDFLKSLDIAERRLRSRKIPRSCLQNQSESVWRKVYQARNDQGLITLAVVCSSGAGGGRGGEERQRATKAVAAAACDGNVWRRRECVRAAGVTSRRKGGSYMSPF